MNKRRRTPRDWPLPENGRETTTTKTHTCALYVGFNLMRVVLCAGEVSNSIKIQAIGCWIVQQC
jgi:hypothetical protein